MDHHESGDDYIRKAAAFIRTHEQSLAETRITQRKSISNFSLLNPLVWLTETTPRSPTVLSFDPHHLFYILIRLQASGFDVGSLDIYVDNPTRPMSYINVVNDKVETSSIASFRSSISAISKLSIGSSWWGRPEPASVDKELKYLFSSFTKLPALSIHAPGLALIKELVEDPPGNNAIPLYIFRNLQSLECLDIDPRSLLGWDRLAESLRSLTIKRSGLDNPITIFVDAILEDQARRNDEARLVTRKLGSVRSFHGAYVPDTVQEEVEEADNTNESDLSPSSRQLSPLKWAFLRHLSLADNALTSLPSTLFTYINTLTHLDLSSNLLVSVPSGLSELYNLVYLNLSDNMIDSVLGIYTKLGQVFSLNLSHNRLDSICGLERLLALEKIDLRHNSIEESAEVGRLSILPNIGEVWIEGNPLITREETYRIKCFDYFHRERKTIILDGSPPGFYERQFLSAAPSESSAALLDSAYASPLHQPSPVPVVVNGPSRSDAAPRSISPSHISSSPSPALSALSGGHRRKKNKRIVELDDGNKRHSSTESQDSNEISNDKREPKGEDMPNSQQSDHSKGDSSLKPQTTTRKIVHKKRHSRHVTEAAPSSPSVDSFSAASQDDADGLIKSSSRNRKRVSASSHEPSLQEENGVMGQMKDADAFRSRIEALRNEVGDSWLHVLSQSQFSPQLAGMKR